MTHEDRPTAAERYARAQESSDLTVKPGACDANALMSAAWADDGLGATLLRLRNEFDAVRQVRDGVAAPVLIPMLASMRGARKALAAFALQMSRRGKGQPVTPIQAMHVSVAVLNAWLDPTCTFCEGRGFNGGYKAPMSLCTACHGSGRRSVRLGQSNVEHDFGAKLMAEVERKVSWVEGGMAILQRGASHR